MDLSESKQLTRSTYPSDIDNILALADYLDTLPAEYRGFDMRTVHHSCGAPACAIGHAMTMPRFQGLDIVKIAGAFCSVKQGSPVGFSAVRWFSLFGSVLCQSIRTPAQWSAHARKYVRELGYDC